jgi:hypothetical protein
VSRGPVRSKHIGKVSELTVATPIRTGCIEEDGFFQRHRELRTYRQRLEGVLWGLQSQILAGIPTPPELLSTIHFARWFILDDDPPRPERAGQLIFTSNFDGDVKLYLRDFSTMIPDDIDSVWGNCAGYPPEGCRNFEAFWRYTTEHQVETSCFVASYPDRTVRDIKLAFASPRS